MKRLLLFLYVIIIAVLSVYGLNQDDFPILKGAYLDQKPPGMIPEIFAPGIISTGYSERIAVFSPDDKEFYFCLWGAPHGIILCMKEINNRWTKPQVVTFSGQYTGEFSMSPDGNSIVMSSETRMVLGEKH